MTDKSFGDHMNRNIVKNPLLSTAVTGLSFEDLTHNAVLLPVSVSQEVVTRPDQQTGTQTHTLWHSDHATLSFPSGDANSNPTPLNLTKTTNAPHTNIQQNIKIEKGSENSSTTVSKASVKPDDDFDVNEYFARLQGTRYVSAPINLPKEENVNLEEKEENLEEINLNDPDKSQTDIQQSLTADIAQNFSQLPTVLPQVASAVFSSFSSMLSMKSREQTPEYVKPSPQEIQFQKPIDPVELVGVKEMPPPPKEPPVVGNTSYRITTKKKYAQLPGLSSGEAPMSMFNPVAQSNPPSYFTPNPIAQNIPTNVQEIQVFAPQPTFEVPSVDNREKFESYAIKDTYDIFNPVNADPDKTIDTQAAKDTNIFNLATVDVAVAEETRIDQPKSAVDRAQPIVAVFAQPDLFAPVRNSEPLLASQNLDQSNLHTSQGFYNQGHNFASASIAPLMSGLPPTSTFLPPKRDNQSGQQNIALPPTPPATTALPPPPTFLPPWQDSQTNAGKSVLPPSVARRISANHPVIKPKAPQSTTFAENIFVPAPLSDSPDVASSIGQTCGSSFQPNMQPSAFVQFNPPELSATQGCMPSSTMSSPVIPVSSSSTTPLNISEISSEVIPPPIAPPKSVPVLSPMTSNVQTSRPILQPSIPPPTSIFTPLLPASTNSEMVVPTLEPKAPTLILLPVNLPLSSPNAPPVSHNQSLVPNVESTTPILPESQATTTIYPPPTFFNPSAMPSQMTKETTLEYQQISSQHNVIKPPVVEPPKPLIEPPKSVGNLNYRMTKKRPQYYSGPIEGIGAISNSIKPVLQPVESTSFHGALFTPTQVQETVSQSMVAANTEQSLAPFDISRPIENAAYPTFDLNKPQGQIYPTFDMNKPQDQTYIQPDYNIAFDMSRQTTELYEPPKEETKGFGIIGSLKSKLGAIDINKIQSSVTTFFDPAYNDLKKEATSVQENVPYEQQQFATYSQQQQQGSNFEVFVPNVEQSQQYSQTYGYNNQNLFNQGQIRQQYYQTDNPFNYCENPQQNLYQQYSYNPQQHVYSDPNVSIHDTALTTNYGQDVAQKTETSGVYTDKIIQEQHITPPSSYYQDNIVRTEQIETSTEVSPVQSIPKLHLESAKNHFVVSQPNTTSSETEDLQNKMADLQIAHNISDSKADTEEKDASFSVTETKDLLPNVALDEGNPADFFDLSCHKETDTTNHANIFGNLSLDVETKAREILLSPQKSEDEKQKQEPSEDKSVVDVSSAPLQNLSNLLAEKSKEVVENNNENMPVYERNEGVDTIFNRNANVSFFDHIEPPENIPIVELQDDSPDLNICETCREVNKPEEDNDTDDLTAQLIENITSPIQLLNPVEVPFTENNTVSGATDFDSNQCAEISHFTEETIETIQVQSATELLETDQLSANLRNYVWCSDESPFQPKVLVETDFSLPDPNRIGFFGNTSLFIDNIPTNASDEIKAEYKFTHEDSPVVLPRQMSIPSAPPAEDDSKSDETGIDVHSIEQDANKDFPIFEEFVVEPNTDDGKIEFEERKRSTEEIQDADSFTSRVEKFKKMEETVAEVFEQKDTPVFDLKNTTSPSLPIASYFDTGNYAAETHYRKSLTSPPNISSIIGSPNSQMRVPPGFEEEYQKRQGGTQEHPHGDRKENIIFVPETSTQTRFTYSPTFGTTKNKDIVTGTVGLSKISEFVQDSVSSYIEKDKLPDFDSIVGIKKNTIEENNPIQTPSLFANLNITTEQKEEFIAKEAYQAQGITLPEANKTIENVNTPAFSNIFGVKKQTSEEPTLEKPLFTHEIAKPPPISSLPNLPDPMNFFSSNVESTPHKSDEDTGFNRLASYFASPTKTGSSKSFFELSQGQDHYRQPVEENKNEDAIASNTKTFFELSQSQKHIDDKNSNLHNIPQEKYIANLNLMRDLTSLENVQLNPDQIVRTVNYFTVEYDNENLTNDLNKGEPDSTKKEHNNNLKEPKIDLGENTERNFKSYDDTTSKNVIKKCKYCCNMNCGYIKKYENVEHESLNTDFKVKKCMETEGEKKKDNTDNMEQQRECDKNNSVTVNFDDFSFQEEANEGVAQMNENRPTSEYTPVKHHWFYRVDGEGKSIWRGFSVTDSRALEDAYHSADLNDTTLVATDGGRYDVNVMARLRTAVYWSDKPSNVRRCSWFYKGTTDARYVPYTEPVAEKLEEEYRHGMTTGEWHRRLVLPNNELVVMHGPAVMVHFLQSSANDAFSSPPQSTMRPRVVRRGYDESEIEDVEPSNIDHLLLLCHGVGSACDMRLRNVEEVVDDFRNTSLQLLQSHYRNSYDSGVVGRVEVLPISWHATLHSGETGVDRRLARITLDSIPRLRSFTNDTVLDVLFYTSPVFCQTIIDTVCSELNRIYSLFLARNPAFTGGVSLGGHSLGSVILYDLLCHQTRGHVGNSPSTSDKIYVTGAAGTGQLTVKYPKLEFSPVALYALGSPIAIFECIRGVDSLGVDFSLPTCENFFNIFHPYDPIAYRIEPLLNPQLMNVKPYLIPHHKGRKRMHLELKDTMARVGADIKQKLIESIKSTWTSMWKTQPPPSDRQLEKVVEEEMEKESLTDESIKEDQTPVDDLIKVTPDMLGKLNNGRRVDYVLQEAPFEIFNEYLFAMSSHVCYWESEDTMLLMLREIYDALGVQPDCTVPQQSMTVQRARSHKPEQTIVLNETDYPSTSRGET